MQDIVNLAYTTNAANLPYINVASNGSIDAYAPTPIPKITKTRTTYNITPTTPKAGPYPQKNTIYCVFGADYSNILRLMAAKCVIGIKIGIIFRIYQLLHRALNFIFVRVPQ